MSNPLAAILPKPEHWLTYPGDCRGNMGRVMGPKLASRDPVTIVDEVYDPNDNTTLIGVVTGVVMLDRN